MVIEVPSAGKSSNSSSSSSFEGIREVACSLGASAVEADLSSVGLSVEDAILGVDRTSMKRISRFGYGILIKPQICRMMQW
jgi:hypothetical protein